MSANIRVQEYSPPVLRESVGSASIGRAVTATLFVSPNGDNSNGKYDDVWLEIQEI